MAKVQKKIWLTQDEVDYIISYQHTHHLRSLSAALGYIVDEHAHKDEVAMTALLVDEIVEKIVGQLAPELKNLRAAVNAAGRDVSVNQLLLNALALYSGYKTLPENNTPQLADAKEAVQKKIEAQRVKKLNQIR